LLTSQALPAGALGGWLCVSGWLALALAARFQRWRFWRIFTLSIWVDLRLVKALGLGY